MSDDRVKEIIVYHNRTKHGFHRLAASSGYLDWANQPLPFRFYEGAPRVELPLGMPDPDQHHLALYRRAENIQPYSINTLAKFLELALGLSAWKEMSGERWSLRMNPSSGNLHPTECHLILPETEGIENSLCHYTPFAHALETRATLSADINAILTGHFGAPGFVAGLSSIFWRESWKYGERAYRYCNIDTGHALAALSFSAALLGWKVFCLTSPSTSEAASVLGLDRTDYPRYEEEQAGLLCFVATGECPAGTPSTVPATLAEELVKVTPVGTPNRLSREHRDWSAITQVAEHSAKPSTEQDNPQFGNRPLWDKSVSTQKAAAIIRRRRSVWEFSREKSIAGRNTFLCILDRTVPRDGIAPFDCRLCPTRVNLALFVHNVSGLEPGLYALIRDAGSKDEMMETLDPDFLWEQPVADFPLYFLRGDDYRNQSATLSCNQQIAGFGLFSAAMIVRFRDSISESPWAYPELFRECGMIGQALYLEAEAQGLRGTGIGCFFDDPVHELLGLEGNSWQSMYHFTVGFPLEDQRLTTYPPYFHLERNG